MRSFWRDLHFKGLEELVLIDNYRFNRQLINIAIVKTITNQKRKKRIQKFNFLNFEKKEENLLIRFDRSLNRSLHHKLEIILP